MKIVLKTRNCVFIYDEIVSEIVLSEDCQHIASRQIQMQQLLTGQNDLFATRRPTLTIKLGNPHDER